MSLYELCADENKYCQFYHKAIPDAIAHFHSAIELLFVQSGTQEVILEGEKHVLKEGDACFCDRFCVHSYPKSKDVKAVVIIGDPSYFERAFAKLGNKTPPNFFSFNNIALLEFLHDTWENSAENKEIRQTAFEGSMGILISEIAKNTPLVSRKKDKQSELIGDVLLYTENHLDGDLSLGVVASAFGYSHEHLSRLLHSYLSENWTAYVNRLRVKKANELLQNNPTCNVLTLALSCGFDSANTFYRAYKKEFGHPPRKINR